MRRVRTARAHRHADVGRGEEGCVIHAVADHRHFPPDFFSALDGGDFFPAIVAPALLDTSVAAIISAVARRSPVNMTVRIPITS